MNTIYQNKIQKRPKGLSSISPKVKHIKENPSFYLNTELRVGLRTSPLALLQVKEIFEALPGVRYNLVPIKSYGDKHKEISLINNNISDFFTRELDNAILSDEIDIAVHSAKDLPYPLPANLEVVALTKVFDQSDSLVSKDNMTLAQLPHNPKIGTSSLLRKDELLKLRPDIQIVSIRGTIEERIAQADNGSVDAVIVATCALKRLFLSNRIADILPYETHPLQGKLAVVAKKDNLKISSLFSAIDARKDYGKVYLVGLAGAPDLLTLRGYKLLNDADVIFYDDLLNKDFISQFKANKIYVGKRSGKHSIEQDGINRLLLKAAELGKNVVRLKGGDPMIFAHGGEETEYLKQNFIEVSVVPGITSALAAAALAQIPLTHRDITSSVTLVSGHKVSNIDFKGNGTMVVYMGASNATAIAEKAINQGRNPDTPVLLISSVSNPDQSEVFTKISKIHESIHLLQTPLLMIIGDVVGLKNAPENKNLVPTIWVTGTSSNVIKGNFKIIHTPLIQVKPLNDYNTLHAIIDKIQEYSWIIFTSRHTVNYFFEQVFITGKDIRSLANNKIASVGTTTTGELLKYGIIPDIQPKDESSEGLLKEFKKLELTGRNVLIPRSNLALPALPEGLTDSGNKVTTIVIYENSIPTAIQTPQNEDYDAIYFSSPSCVENFIQLGQKFLQGKKFIVQGNPTFFKLISSGVKPSQVYTKEDFESSMFYI